MDGLKKKPKESPSSKRCGHRACVVFPQNQARLMCNREASGEIRVQIQKGGDMTELLRKIWQDDEGQDIAEYAVMLAVILVIVVGTIKLVGTQANTIFSETASSLQ